MSSALSLALLASVFTALSSLFFRKNADSAALRSPSTYLVFFYFCALVASFFFAQDIWNTPVNFIILAIGACVGVFSSTVMFLTSRALSKGPAALTFAFQNASAIFPGLILFFFLGSDFGFSCSYLQLTGMCLVLTGLFLGARREAQTQPEASFDWIKYALACFLVQIFALTFIQGRCILFDGGYFTASSADDVWFMPGQFGAAFLIQLVICLKNKQRIELREMAYGCFAGAANFSSNSLLLLATKFAFPMEKSILFPIFAVSSMILCNVWANRLYRESFNLRTNAICTLGIILSVY